MKRARRGRRRGKREAGCPRPGRTALGGAGAWAARGAASPLRLWLSAGASLFSPRRRKPDPGASPAASLRPHGAQPAPGPGVPQQRAPPRPPARAQPGTSDVREAKTGSGRAEPAGRRAGSGKVAGSAAGLTCAAASCASWSAPRPTWAPSGRWRGHLPSLESGRGTWAALASLGSPRLGIPARPGRLPGKLSASPTRSLNPDWPCPSRRPEPEVWSRFRCKRGRGPALWGQGPRGTRPLRGCRGDPVPLRAPRPALRGQPRLPGTENWPPGAGPGRR